MLGMAHHIKFSKICHSSLTAESFHHEEITNDKKRIIQQPHSFSRKSLDTKHAYKSPLTLYTKHSSLKSHKLQRLYSPRRKH